LLRFRDGQLLGLLVGREGVVDRAFDSQQLPSVNWYEAAAPGEASAVSARIGAADSREGIRARQAAKAAGDKCFTVSGYQRETALYKVIEPTL